MADVDDDVVDTDPRRSSKTFPKAHADIVPAAQPQPHLRRPHEGHRRAVEGRRDQLRVAPGRSRGRAAWSATCARTSRTSRTRNLQGRSRSSARKGGDCFARYLVRMEEMLESLKIIEAAVENLPGRAGERRPRTTSSRSRTRRRRTAASRG